MFALMDGLEGLIQGTGVNALRRCIVGCLAKRSVFLRGTGPSRAVLRPGHIENLPHWGIPIPCSVLARTKVAIPYVALGLLASLLERVDREPTSNPANGYSLTVIIYEVRSSWVVCPQLGASNQRDFFSRHQQYVVHHL